MKILVVVASEEERVPMMNLLARAGIKDYRLTHLFINEIESKPSMKVLRQVKEQEFDHITAGFDYILAAGETAARLVLDTSSVNINKMRGRDYEFKFGVKDVKKKSKEQNTNPNLEEERGNEDSSKSN